MPGKSVPLVTPAHKQFPQHTAMHAVTSGALISTAEAKCKMLGNHQGRHCHNFLKVIGRFDRREQVVITGSDVDIHSKVVLCPLEAPHGTEVLVFVRLARILCHNINAVTSMLPTRAIQLHKI